jgi:hypothetical protein
MNTGRSESGETTPVSAFLRRHLEPSLEMLEEDLRLCPDDLWEASAAGYPYWQQIYHALESLDFWLSVRVLGGNADDYSVRRFGKDVSPDLDASCRETATKAELSEYLDDLRVVAEAALRSVDDGGDEAVDAFFTQIRHIQYHVGHADAALRTRGVAPGEWMGYGE